MSEEKISYIAGFWRRIAALFIDLIIMGMLGFILGFVFENTFAEMGPRARLVGLLVSLLYFGLMNSKLSHGQTVGKILLKIKVVNKNNESISISKSFTRYIILALPFFLNGFRFSSEAMFSYWSYLLSFIIFGGLFSIIYLYIFNKRTRQSLHDIVAGTFVVNVNIEQQELTNDLKKIHIIIVSIFFLIAAIAPKFTFQLMQTESFKGLIETQVAITKLPLVSYADISSVLTTKNTTKNGVETITAVNTRVYLYKNNITDANLAREIAQIVVKNFPKSINKDVIQVTPTYGYDIGIWSQWFNFIYSFKPSELEQPTNNP